MSPGSTRSKASALSPFSGEEYDFAHEALLGRFNLMLGSGRNAMRQVQVVPKDNFRLYGAIVAKEVELSHKHKGTFHRSGPKAKDRAKWSHANYDGWLNLARSMGEVVAIEVRSKKPEKEWMLLRALLGFLDRHFAEKIQAINIQMYESYVKPKRRRRRR